MLGVEAPQPKSLLAASFLNLRVEMTYSHDLVSSGVLAVGAAALGYVITRRRAVALWCLALVVAHEACDLVVGFPHHVLGPASAGVGLGLYGRAPEVAFGLEAVFGASCVAWFRRARARRGRPVSRRTTWGLYLVFIVG